MIRAGAWKRGQRTTPADVRVFLNESFEKRPNPSQEEMIKWSQTVGWGDDPFRVRVYGRNLQGRNKRREARNKRDKSITTEARRPITPSTPSLSTTDGSLSPNPSWDPNLDLNLVLAENAEFSEFFFGSTFRPLSLELVI